MSDEKKKPKQKKTKAAKVEKAPEAKKPAVLRNTLANNFMISGDVKIIGLGEITLSAETEKDDRAMAKIARAVEIGVLEWR